MKTVLLVGSRRGALEAARRLGLRILLAADRPPPARLRRSLAGYSVLDGAGAEASVERAVSLCREGPPDAVVALTEAAALPAAEARVRLGVPGTGPDVARRCRDKVVMKTRARESGIPCADFVEIESSTGAGELVERLGLPVVVKQRASSGGRGMTIAPARDALAAALRPGWVAERFVHGVEMSYESILAEGRIVFGNPTEYLLPGWASIVPARLDHRARAEVEAFNARVLSAFEVCRGMTHLEIFLTPSGPVFGEIAARPPGGYLMELIARAYGFDPWETLLRIELGEDVAPPRRAAEAAGNWILHPGEGVLAEVRGLAQARAVPGVEEVRCRVAAGDAISCRVGTGQDVGWILARAEGADRVEAALREARRRLRLEVEP